MISPLASAARTHRPPAFVICVAANQILLGPDGTWTPLRWEQLPSAISLASSAEVLDLGAYQTQTCGVVELSPADAALLAHPGFEWAPLRTQLGIISDDAFQLAGRALQVVNWRNTHRFCGGCGTATQLHAVERAAECDKCELLFYPRLSPCVIGIVEHQGHCLLAHNTRFKDQKYSALAGFIEPGETAEQALSREVEEEVGIRIRNIRYFGSQPWPFPGQLMLGFHAEYAGGDIKVDQLEIDDAQWFHASRLPLVPPETTISGQLIQDFVRRTLGT